MGLFTLAYILLMLILLVFVTLNVSFSFCDLFEGEYVKFVSVK